MNSASEHPALGLKRRRLRGWIYGLAVPFLCVVPVLGWWLAARAARERPATLPVRREKLHHAIVARGDLDAAETTDIICHVRSRSPGRQNSTTIRWIVPDGSRVERGQVVVELDDAALQDELDARRTPLELAKSDRTVAERNLDIVRSQNATDIKTAEVALQLAELDLKKYVLGDFQQTRKEVEGRLLQAQTDLDMWLERTTWTERMRRRGYATRLQQQSEQSRMQSAEIAQRRVAEELRVLDRYTFERTKKEWEAKAAEARRALERVKIQARAKEAQAEADRLSKERRYHRLFVRSQEVEEQIACCRITAPHDGMVVYFQSRQSRSGSGSMKSVVAEGEPVFEGQRLMRIPDMSRQVVRVSVPEAVIRRVHGEEHEPTGFSDRVQAALSVTPNLHQLLLGQFAWSELRPQYHDRDQRLVYAGQPARIHIDSLSDRALHGHVKQVSNTPTASENRDADVRFYETLVAIDETVVNVRPDLSAEVTILDDEEPEPVLAVPVKAVVHVPGQGDSGTCFVLTPDGPAAREVHLGQSDEQFVEVRDGLSEGEEVVLDPARVKTKH